MKIDRPWSRRVRAASALCFLALLLPSPGAGAAERYTILEHVPADAPYAFAMLEPLPPELTEKMMSLVGEAWDELSRIAGKAAATAPEMKSVARVVRVIGMELEGARGEEALGRLGLSAKGRAVIYGVGGLPVLRMELKDGAALRGVVDRAAAAAEVTLPTREHKGVPYWRFEDGGGAVVVAIVGDNLVAGLAPPRAVPGLLPYVLGKRKPKRALKASTLKGLAR